MCPEAFGEGAEQDSPQCGVPCLPRPRAWEEHCFVSRGRVSTAGVCAPPGGVRATRSVRGTRDGLRGWAGQGGGEGWLRWRRNHQRVWQVYGIVSGRGTSGGHNAACFRAPCLEVNSPFMPRFKNCTRTAVPHPCKNAGKIPQVAKTTPAIVRARRRHPPCQAVW